MKTQYIQPEVQVTDLTLASRILTGSPTPPPGNNMNINPGIPTDEQW